MTLLKKRRVLSILLAVVLMFSLALMIIPHASATNEYPMIGFGAFDADGNRYNANYPVEVTAGDTLTLKLFASWASGATLVPEYTYFQLVGPDGSDWYSFDVEEEPNNYYHTLSIDSTWTNGTYSITYIQVNNTNNDSVIAVANYVKFIVVGCGEEDNTGPVLDDFSVTPKNARPGEAVTVTAKAHDTQTTMGQNRVSSIPGTMKAVFASGEDTVEVNLKKELDGDEFTGIIDLNEDVAYGTYSLQKLVMKDRLGNTTEFDPAAEGLDIADYQFVYSDKDNDGPEVLDIQLSAKEVAVGDKLTFTLKATDVSGLDLNKSQIVYSNGKKSYLLRFKPTNEPDVYEASVVIPSSYDKGTYYVKTLLVADNEGNNTFASFDNCTFKVVSRSASGYSGDNSVLWFLRNLGFGIAQAAGAGGNDFDTTFSIIDYIISII